jgi:hypothetical protein
MILIVFFNERLKPEINNEMIKTSWLSLAQAFSRSEELEKLAKQKTLTATKINEPSVD